MKTVHSLSSSLHYRFLDRCLAANGVYSMGRGGSPFMSLTPCGKKLFSFLLVLQLMFLDLQSLQV